MLTILPFFQHSQKWLWSLLGGILYHSICTPTSHETAWNQWVNIQKVFSKISYLHLYSMPVSYCSISCISWSWRSRKIHFHCSSQTFCTHVILLDFSAKILYPSESKFEIICEILSLSTCTNFTMAGAKQFQSRFCEAECYHIGID